MSNSFDFEQFKANVIEQLKAGVPLSSMCLGGPESHKS